MSIRLNGSFVEMINTKEDDIALIKLNGQVLFPNSNQINLSYINNVFYIKGYYGEYELRYANDDGPLEDYDRIGVVNVYKDEGDLPYLMTLNVAPKEADKIIVCRKNTNEVVGEIEIPNTLKMVDLGEKLYSFGALSDVHIDGNGTDEASASSDFARALQFFNNKASLVAISGDLCVTNGYAELSLFKDLVDANSTIPVYASRGNHDCRYTLEEFETYVGGGLYYEKTYGDDVFIFLGMNAENYGSTMLTTEELDWLETKLEEYKTKRVFLFFHVFMDDTCGNINGLYPYSNMDTSVDIVHRFDALMVKYRNVVYFSGHSHLEFYCQRLGANANIYSNGSICFRVHIPSCAKPRVNYEGGREDTYSFHDGSEGYLVDVYKDYIVLKGVNFIKGKFVPIAQYILNTSKYTIIDNNIYDYLRDNKGNGWISEGEGKLYLTNSNSSYSYIDIKPNTTYKITKMFGSRLRVGTSEVEPTSEMALSKVMKNDAGVDLTITTGKNDKYLLIEYWYRSLDGETELDYRRSITVEKIGGETIAVNLFDGVWSKGYFTNTGEVWNSDDGGYGPQYMNVGDNSTLYILFNALQEHELGRLFVNEYDADMNFIQRVVPVNADVLPVGISKYKMSLSENTKYIRVSFYKIDDFEDAYSVVNDYFQLALSTTELDEFIPYEGGNLFKTSAILYSSSGSQYTSGKDRNGVVYTYDTGSENVTVNGTTTGSATQGFKVSNTLTAGKTYKLYAEVVSGSVSLGSKNHSLLIELKTNYTGEALCSCYTDSLDTSTMPEIGTYTPTSDVSEWYIMISHRSSEVVYSNYTIAIHVEEVTDPVNLYDYSTAPTLDGYISRSAYTIKSSTTDKTTYLQIEPNSKYKVTKTASSRFVIGTFSDVPEIGGASGNKVIDDYTGTTLYITSGENDNYLAIQYYVTSDTLTEEALRQSIQVVKVENTTENNLMPDFVASSGTVAGVTYNFIEGTNKFTLSGTASSSSHIYSPEFAMNLIVGKTYAFRFNIVSGSIDASAHEDSYYDKNLISVDDIGATAKMVEKDDVETPFHEQQFVVTQTYPYYKIDIKLKSNDIYTNTEIEVEVVQLD